MSLPARMAWVGCWAAETEDKRTTAESRIVRRIMLGLKVTSGAGWDKRECCGCVGGCDPRSHPPRRTRPGAPILLGRVRPGATRLSRAAAKGYPCSGEVLRATEPRTPPSFSFPGHAAEGEANIVSGDFSLRKSSQKQSSKSKVIGGNSYQFAECITPNLGYKR